MNNKRFWLASLAMIIYVVMYEWMFHSSVLGNIYAATTSVWRPEENMLTFMPWMTAGQVLFAILFCWIFSITTCPSTVKAGAWYGLVMGLFASSLYFIYYAVLPIPMSLFVFWVLGKIVETVIAGIILSKIYPKP